jgi:hypothetical protein
MRLWPTQPVLSVAGQAVSRNGRPIFSFPNGSKMGIYKGVSILSNGINTGSDSGPLEQQCVGFVKNFYRKVYGVDIGKVGTATNLGDINIINKVSNDNLGSRQFIEYRNGSSPIRPQADDIVGWQGGPNGHVGVVVNVGFNNQANRGYIDVVEQNWGRGNLHQGPISRHTLTRDSQTGNYTIANRGSYELNNWLRLVPRSNSPLNNK